MNSWAKRVEVATNIAILCAFIMVAALAAQRLLSTRAGARDGQPAIGARVTLAGVDWSKADRTLVLALSTTCHFCSESAPFYKRLLTDASSHGVRALAVLPQPIDSSRAYLAGLGVPLPNIIQRSLGEIDVAATPTLLIVDARGNIQKAWVGKLAADREEQVIAAVR
jgi:hypothetical protein